MLIRLLAYVVAIVIAAAICIYADISWPRRVVLFYIFKPLTTVLVILLALLPGTFITTRYAQAIVIGLLCSLMGDIWLMLPWDRFLYGLGSFLVAHIAYAFAFLEGASLRGLAVALLLLAIAGAFVLRLLWPGLPTRMKIPVSVYVGVILLMAALAVARAVGQPSVGSVLAAVGALLFVTSDGSLAINRFARPFLLARPVVLGTYYAAQTLIALSVGIA